LGVVAREKKKKGVARRVLLTAGKQIGKEGVCVFVICQEERNVKHFFRGSIGTSGECE